MFEKLTAINWLLRCSHQVRDVHDRRRVGTAQSSPTCRRLHGHTEEVVKQMQAMRPPPVFFGTMIVAYIVGAAAMALLVVNLDLRGLGAGVSLGLVLWLFGTAALGLTDQITRLRPFAALANSTAPSSRSSRSRSRVSFSHCGGDAPAAAGAAASLGSSDAASCFRGICLVLLAPLRRLPVNASSATRASSAPCSTASAPPRGSRSSGASPTPRSTSKSAA